MNGPQHYRNAEAAIEDANHTTGQERTNYLAAAQAHATLALAAATALPTNLDAQTGRAADDEWVDATTAR